MSFLRITSPGDFPRNLRGGVIAIGNFDGLHRGHQAVLGKAVGIARSKGVSASVLTFEPHPRTVFRPEHPVFRLTPAPVKAELIESLGFDAVVEHPFSRDFASTTANRFVDDILVAGFGLAHVVTGYNFHFARDREGNPEFLRNAGERLGFSVTTVEPFQDEGGETVSSSRIRELLSCGEIAEANGLLGYVWRVHGEVIRGAGLGRTLNYPTANLSLPPESALKHGIYAVRIRLEDGTLHDGVASYGRRPTFDNGDPLLETFVFDFSGDLYGQEVEVFLHGWIRGEEKFGSTDELVARMDRDSEEARAILANFGPEQGLLPLAQP